MSLTETHDTAKMVGVLGVASRLQTACCSAVTAVRVGRPGLRSMPHESVSVVVQCRGMAHGRKWMEKKGTKGFKKRVTEDVVLIQDVAGVGVEGQVVSVSRGYAINFLVRNGKGEIATTLNRHLYAKPISELTSETKSENAMIDHLNRWVKTIENTEIKITVFKPSEKKYSVLPFAITSWLNRRRNMNIPAFAVETIQPVVENEDEITAFTRREFDKQLADFDALKLGEAFKALEINKPGKYIVTLDLAKGLELPEPIKGRLRFNLVATGEGAAVDKTDKPPKRVRSINPRKQLYRQKAGMTNAKWEGWAQVN